MTYRVFLLVSRCRVSGRGRVGGGFVCGSCVGGGFVSRGGVSGSGLVALVVAVRIGSDGSDDGKENDGDLLNTNS